jgi:outer membrane protein OmpA-like peptidoglycan-associated protein
LKEIASKNQLVTVSVAGYTQPTLINPNPQKLSVDRAKAVVKALKALGINAKISATGKGNAKTNKPTSRYALLTITGTALK